MAGEIDQYVSFAHRLAEAAAQQTLPRFRQPLPIHWKEPQDPVTPADTQAEKAMRALIRTTYPQHGILAEEGDDIPAQSSFTWVLDPIDGTRSFICGMPLWSTLIGLCQDERPLLGLLHQPFTQECFVAAPGHAHHTHKGKQTPLSSRQDVPLARAVLATTSPQLLPDQSGFDALAQKTQFTLYGGDAYLYGLLARGFVDLVVESGLQAYDILPLVPLIEAAGGRITDWHGNPIRGLGTHKRNVLAAANHSLHAQALSVLSVLR